MAKLEALKKILWASWFFRIDGTTRGPETFSLDIMIVQIDQDGQTRCSQIFLWASWLFRLDGQTRGSEIYLRASPWWSQKGHEHLFFAIHAASMCRGSSNVWEALQASNAASPKILQGSGLSASALWGSTPAGMWSECLGPLGPINMIVVSLSLPSEAFSIHFGCPTLTL